MFGSEFNMFGGSDVSLTGLKLAKVISNADPKAQERVFGIIQGIHDMENTDPEYGVWIMHCAPSKWTSGEIPDVDDYIWVMNVDNDPMTWVYFGYARVTS